jgi:hypothetical protein
MNKKQTALVVFTTYLVTSFLFSLFSGFSFTASFSSSFGENLELAMFLYQLSWFLFILGIVHALYIFFDSDQSSCNSNGLLTRLTSPKLIKQDADTQNLTSSTPEYRLLKLEYDELKQTLDDARQVLSKERSKVELLKKRLSNSETQRARLALKLKQLQKL